MSDAKVTTYSREIVQSSENIFVSATIIPANRAYYRELMESHRAKVATGEIKEVGGIKRGYDEETMGMHKKIKAIFAEAAAVTNGLAREDMKPELREMFFFKMARPRDKRASTTTRRYEANAYSDTTTRFLDAL